VQALTGMFSEDLSVLDRPARAPDELLRYGDEADQVADVRYGGADAQRRPLVLLVHGGFWRPQYDRAHTGPMGEAIAAAGWTVAAIEYRRVPGQPDLTLRDVRAALQRVPGMASGHSGEVLLLGHSAGGHLVLWLSAPPASVALAGTVALAPAADLQLAQALNLGNGAATAFLGTESALRPDADPRRLPSPQVPVTIVQGEEDRIVPPALAESYVAAHPAARLVRVPDAGHFALIDPLAAAWHSVIEALRALSARRAGLDGGQ
jgi:acetyl esterase/lipase